MSEVTLTAGTKSWAIVTVQSVNGQGRVAPRLVFSLGLRTPTERIVTQLQQVQVQVMFASELIGQGLLIGEPVPWHGGQTQLEVPVNHRLLDYVTTQIGKDPYVSLQLRWRGVMEVTLSPGQQVMHMSDDPEPGVPTQVRIAYGQWVDHYVSIARSDWYQRVLQPTRNEDYIYLEIAVPRGPHAGNWGQAIGHLHAAEKAYADGDDAGVFSKLKGVFEALPGAKQHIFDALPEPKRREVNELAKGMVNYLNHGRHVTTGAEGGDFPVNRLDAELALSLTKVMLSYASRALPSA